MFIRLIKRGNYHTQVRPAAVDAQPKGAESTGFISWERLADSMKASGELRSDEMVSSMAVDETGVKYTVEKVN